MIDAEETKIIFGRRLKAERALKGIERKELTNFLQLNKAAIGMYETGKNFPSVEVLINIANYLDVSIDYLLCRTEERTAHQ